MILVTGATGNIGHFVVEMLVKRGQKVRAVIPTPTVQGFQPPNIHRHTSFPSGVDVVEGDLQRPQEIADAFSGIESIFINPRAVGQSIDEIIELAKANGVRRIVTLSASNIDEPLERQPSRLNGDRNREVEQAVVASGLEWTALRSTYYAINTVGTWAPQIKHSEVVYGPYADWANSPLDEFDIAEASVQALLTDVALSEHPIISGPESLTQREMVETIGRIIGKSLKYVEIPPEEAKKKMIQAGLPSAFVDEFLGVMEQDHGKTAILSSDLERILGRKPHTFAEWVARHRADFE